MDALSPERYYKFKIDKPKIITTNKNWIIGTRQNLKIYFDLKELPKIPALKLNLILHDIDKKNNFKTNQDEKGYLKKLFEKKVFAIKPLTFMNSSGVCIKELVDYFKIEPGNVFVFHDDMDIILGKVKAKFGGSDAGHNGIASIDKNIGKQYSRVRIGIGRPKEKSAVTDHVLDDFSSDETKTINTTSNIFFGV